MKNKRMKDLTTVFNETWKANHNNGITNAKKKQAEFNRKMYGNAGMDLKPLTNNEKLENMKKNMDAVFRNERNKFK